MTEHMQLRICLAAFVLVVIWILGGMALPNWAYDGGFGVALSPASIVLKVGEKAGINVTVTSPEKVNGTQVCFALEGFPTSGFRTSFTPECSSFQNGGFSTVLTVEVTPAAAPQTVTAYVIARSGNETARTVLNVSVEPAMPAWIPWLGLLLFFSVLGIAIAWKPRSSAKRTGRKSTKQRRC